MHAYLSAEDYRSLVVDHCQLVEQFENLVVVVIQLWEMNNASRERLDLPRQPLPIAASLACAARIAALTTFEPLSPQMRYNRVEVIDDVRLDRCNDRSELPASAAV